MALKALLDNIDSLSDELKKEYKKQDDGKFILDVESVDGLVLENVTGLKSAFSKEKDNRRKAEDSLKAFDGLDITKAKEAMDKVKDMANWTPEEKVKEQIASQTEAIKTKLQGEIDKGIETIKGLDGQLSTHIIDNAAIAALAKHKGSAPLLLHQVRAQIKVIDTDDGRKVAQVIDPKTGVPRVTMEANSTEPMSIDELVKSMKNIDEFKPAFDGNGSSGSGANGGAGGQNNMAKLSQDKLDGLAPVEKIALGHTQGDNTK